MAEERAREADHPTELEINRSVNKARHLVTCLNVEILRIIQYLEETVGNQFPQFKDLDHKRQMFLLHANHEIEGFETYDFEDRKEYDETELRLYGFIMYRRTKLFYDVVDKFMDECCTQLYHDYEHNVLLKETSKLPDALKDLQAKLAVDIETVEDRLDEAREYHHPRRDIVPKVRPNIPKFFQFLLEVHKNVKLFVFKHRVIVIETKLEKFLHHELVPRSQIEIEGRQGPSRSSSRVDLNRTVEDPGPLLNVPSNTTTTSASGVPKRKQAGAQPARTGRLSQPPSRTTQPARTGRPSQPPPRTTQPARTGRPSQPPPRTTQPAHTGRPSQPPPRTTQPTHTGRPSQPPPRTTQPARTGRPSQPPPRTTQPARTGRQAQASAKSPERTRKPPVPQFSRYTAGKSPKARTSKPPVPRLSRPSTSTQSRAAQLPSVSTGARPKLGTFYETTRRRKPDSQPEVTAPKRPKRPPWVDPWCSTPVKETNLPKLGTAFYVISPPRNKSRTFDFDQIDDGEHDEQSNRTKSKRRVSPKLGTALYVISPPRNKRRAFDYEKIDDDEHDEQSNRRKSDRHLSVEHVKDERGGTSNRSPHQMEVYKWDENEVEIEPQKVVAQEASGIDESHSDVMQGAWGRLVKHVSRDQLKSGKNLISDGGTKYHAPRLATMKTVSQVEMMEDRELANSRQNQNVLHTPPRKSHGSRQSRAERSPSPQQTQRRSRRMKDELLEF